MEASYGLCRGVKPSFMAIRWPSTWDKKVFFFSQSSAYDSERAWIEPPVWDSMPTVSTLKAKILYRLVDSSQNWRSSEKREGSPKCECVCVGGRSEAASHHGPWDREWKFEGGAAEHRSLGAPNTAATWHARMSKWSWTRGGVKKSAG